LTNITTTLNDMDSTGALKRETTAGETDAETQGVDTQTGRFNMRKRISSTAYEVAVYFNPESREMMDDKIAAQAHP